MARSIPGMLKSVAAIPERMNRRIFLDHNHDYRTTVFISGVGRSGTSWVSKVMNHKNEYRHVFEPFHPGEVKEARAFGYHRYLRPDNREAALLSAAKTILSGAFKSPWTDRYNKKRLVSGRIIKDIRTNLMLKWIHANFPGMPIVLLFRHPCAVANSRFQIHWDSGPELNRWLSHHELMEDFLEPFRSLIEDAKDDFEKHILFWCILNYVPLQQFRKGEIHLAFYEEFCVNPGAEIDRLFSFLNIEIDDRISDTLRKPSHQARKESPIITGDSLVDSWRKTVTPEQVQASLRILGAFGLAGIYSESSMPNVDYAHEVMGDR